MFYDSEANLLRMSEGHIDLPQAMESFLMAITDGDEPLKAPEAAPWHEAKRKRRPRRST